MKRYSTLFLVIAMSITAASAQTVVTLETPADLADSWNDVVSQARAETGGNFVIGYMLPRKDWESGGVNIYDDRARKSIGALVGGTDDEQESVRQHVILVEYQTGSRKPVEIQGASLHSRYHFEPEYLFWLDETDEASSLKLLGKWIDTDDGTEFQEDLQSAIGMHSPSAKVVGMLEVSALGNSASDVREKASFWLGQTDREDAHEILRKVVDTDKSSDVREKGVFAISQLDLASATQTLFELVDHRDTEVGEKAVFWLSQRESKDVAGKLKEIVATHRNAEIREKAVFAISQLDEDVSIPILIDLAQSDGDREVQKKAIFWLSQAASERVAEPLAQIATGDGSSEIQEQAVFAISQLEPDESIPLLVDIAKNHGNVDVRKKAVFWLGQSDDERATKAIISLVSN